MLLSAGLPAGILVVIAIGCPPLLARMLALPGTCWSNAF